MRLSLIAIDAGADAAMPMDRAALADLLWAAAATGDRVEHISVRCRPDRIEIGVYSRYADGPEAILHALGLVGRALASPALRRWVLISAADLPLLEI